MISRTRFAAAPTVVCLFLLSLVSSCSSADARRFTGTWSEQMPDATVQFTIQVSADWKGAYSVQMSGPFLDGKYTVTLAPSPARVEGGTLKFLVGDPNDPSTSEYEVRPVDQNTLAATIRKHSGVSAKPRQGVWKRR